MASPAEALRALADHLEEQEHLEAELAKAKEAHGDKDPNKRAQSSKTKDDLQTLKEALRAHRERGRTEGLTVAAIGELMGNAQEGSVNVSVGEPAKATGGVKRPGEKDGE